MRFARLSEYVFDKASDRIGFFAPSLISASRLISEVFTQSRAQRF
jgi:hypothetical protein